MQQAEARSIRDFRIHDQLIREGWHESNVPVDILEELQIAHEVMSDRSAYVPGAQVYAPVWVFGVWFNAGMPIVGTSVRWAIVKALLATTRDSMNEQQTLTAELSMDTAVPASVRRSALNLIEVLQGRRKRKVGDEHP
jgi:hypothetical protein